MSKNKIIPQMFDVRPVDNEGILDWKKISQVGDLKKQKHELRKRCLEKRVAQARGKAFCLGVAIESHHLPILHKENFNLKAKLGNKESILNVRKKINTENENEQERLRLLELKKIEQINLLEQQRKLQQQQTVELANLQQREAKALIAQQKIKANEAVKAAKLLKRQTLLHEKQQRAFVKKQKFEKRKQQKQQQKAAIVQQRLEKKALREQYLLNLRKKIQLDFFEFQYHWKRFVPAFVALALIFSLGIGSVSFASKGFGAQEKVLSASQNGYANLTNAVGLMQAQNFEQSAEQFSQAFENFSQASAELEDLGGGLLDATRFLPFVSKVSSGKNAIEAGKHFSAAGKELNQVVSLLAQLKKSSKEGLKTEVSLLEIFKMSQQNILKAKEELDAAQKNVDLIAIDDLPADKQEKFLLLKDKLPEIRSIMEIFLKNSHIFVELLGGNGPRKYLFLFQNNSEMRATGGFIGSYGLLDIANGHVKKFFIDGIFNPDGQLKDRVVPPIPIQKISGAWSLHDSNWFADFPTSAQKAISFYEKTGGPTADGVITLTPTVMQKLLKITGPIEMPEYGVTLDSENFIELTQYKVEVDYDKQENKPKKILSDLAPLLLEKLFSSKDLLSISRTLQALLEGLDEKHILLYSQNAELENIISAQGWDGKILQSDKDYLSVINTNINGFKTDAVVQEEIAHKAEIQADGSVVDTVKITRTHQGGNSQYAWLNKVNADYLRVFVPKDSQLLEVSGQTREADKVQLDYEALGFKRDNEVENQEKSIKIDQNSGTRIYEESGKTVFANWVYVSPQESVTIIYKYRLPFRLFQVSMSNSQKVDSYSLVAQKQAGSFGSKFSSRIIYPENYAVKWSSPPAMKNENNELKNEVKLTTDYFEGVVFGNGK